MSASIWLRAIRAPFLTATVVPVCVGSAAAWHDTGGFLWGRFWAAMVGALLIHVGTNLANDYSDHVSGADEANPMPTPFSGGSRVIQEGLIPPRTILTVAVLSLALGGSIGLYLNLLTRGSVILALGLFGIFLGYFYSGGPVRLGYRGLGELAVGIGFGPLMVAGSYYVQTESLPPRIFLVALPVGILIALVLLINGFPDREADRAVGKRTLVVLLGRAKATVLYHALLAGVYVVVALLASFRVLPRYSLIAFLSLPLAWTAFVVSRRAGESIEDLLPANAATIGLHSLVGGLLVVGFVLDRLV